MTYLYRGADELWQIDYDKELCSIYGVDEDPPDEEVTDNDPEYEA